MRGWRIVGRQETIGDIGDEMAVDLRRLKAGDSVYVVPQKSDTGFEAKIVRIGRKYGYVRLSNWQSQEPFSLNTGYSHHDPNHNARLNKYGFDVYRSKHQYDAAQNQIALRKRLDKRLTNRDGFGFKLHDMSDDLVTDIHAVLDKHSFRMEIK